MSVDGCYKSGTLKALVLLCSLTFITLKPICFPLFFVPLQLLLSKCIDPIKRVSLELGGNAPFIVFNSANIDAAIEGAITAKFRHTAQVFTEPLSFGPKIYEII